MPSWICAPRQSPHGTTPPPVLYRRYNPGHYVAINDTQQGNAVGQDSGTVVLPPFGTINYADSGIPGGHTRIAGPWTTTTAPVVGTFDIGGKIVPNSGSRGILMPYWWSELEPAKGIYNLTRMIADLAVCKFLGLQLIARIDTRSFADVNDLVPGDPNGVTDNARYLAQFPYSVNYSLSGGGWQISRWNSFVQSRFNLLVQQIEPIGADPNFEGIATQETSGGLSSQEETDTGYTSAGYLAGLLAEHDFINAASPSWRHFGYTNYIPDSSNATGDAKVETYFQYLANNGGVPGNPDILPDNHGIQTRVYPHFDNVYANAHPFNGPTFSCAQPNSYGQAARTLQQLMDFATGSGAAIGGRHLYCDYLFWQFQAGVVGPANDKQFNPQARPVITGTPTFSTYVYPP